MLRLVARVGRDRVAPDRKGDDPHFGGDDQDKPDHDGEPSGPCGGLRQTTQRSVAGQRESPSLPVARHHEDRSRPGRKPFGQRSKECRHSVPDTLAVLYEEAGATTVWHIETRQG